MHTPRTFLKHNLKSLLLFYFLLVGLVTTAQKTTALFNGKDLTGWKIHGTEKWYVQDGELICESGPDKQYGYLSTDKNYGNFILTLQFKQEANGNSGVFFHSQIPEGVKISGWQAEVAPSGEHTGGIYESYGRGWLVIPKPEDEKYLKMGDWNTYKIKVDGDEVTTWLNDHMMVNMKDEKTGTGNGFIALQIHDGGGIKVRWRKIKITELN
jgi:3-keto-disaccharide hydrolase